MTATLTRRAMFGGAGKVATVMALAAAPTVVSAALSSHPDADIIAALHRWQTAVRAYVASPLEVDNSQWEAMLAVADDELQSVAAMPVQTIDGLAIKSFMAMRYEYSGAHYHELLPDLDSGNMVDQTLPSAVLADLLRLSPILAAVVA